MIGIYLAIITMLNIRGQGKSTATPPVALECEYLKSPLGIDSPHPRLSWQIQAGVTHERQTAYTLTVYTDSTARLIQWQMRRFSATQLTVYAGKPLHPYTRYYWKVSVNDVNGKKATSAMANFETGPMRTSDWKGDWITDRRDINLKPAAYFRKTFSLQKNIASARVYIAAAGLYELYINGQKIGDHVLDPAFTRFDRRTLFVTYDVTRQLQRGENAIGVLLGNGWYNFQPISTWFFDKAPWRERPCFCMDLRITYTNGHTETISTGYDWKRALSPVEYNSIYTGEYYDATKDSIGWNNTGYNDQHWKYVALAHAPSERIVAEAMHPIRDVEQLAAVSVEKFNDTDYVFDIGRNIAGVSQISLKGDPGTVISLKYGERLDNNGHVDQSNIDYFLDSMGERFQVDKYTLKGGGAQEIYKPRFSYKGFRYVEASSNKVVKLSKESLTAWFEHSDVPIAGTINCSNDLINKIWQASNSSYLSNLFGYPTDCPQREKNGWTGDAHFAIETGLYNFDAITIYEKWLADIRDAQQPNGTLPAIVPTSDWGYNHHNTLDWESGLILIPWELYQFYGDSNALQQNYATMCRYIGQVSTKYPDQIVLEGLGDRGAITYNPDISLTSTAYYYADVTILAKTAKLFNLKVDYQKYSLLAAKIKEAFNYKFYHNGLYGHGFQTDNSAALYWGLVSQQNKALVADNLAKSVYSDSVHMDIGVLGARTILNALSDNGYAAVAYKLATKRTFPSWGYWMDNGLTTLPEGWDFHANISLNHIFLGGISGWFYQGLGGIFADEKQPGFKHILLRPNIVAGLDSFTAKHEGPYGQIVSGWKMNKGMIIYTATIPPNCSADLVLTMQDTVVKKAHLNSGTYHFPVSQTQINR